VSRCDPAEEELRERQRMDLVGQLSLGLAHDINNMLAVAWANLDYLGTLPSEQRTRPEVSESIEDALWSLKRARDLTSRLLTAARPTERREVVDTSAVLVEMVKLLGRTLPKSSSVESEIEPGVFVLGDSGALETALTNLCINARDAMPDGGTLRIVAEHPVMHKPSASCSRPGRKRCCASRYRLPS
jgi:signal transduction histidine kinase